MYNASLPPTSSAVNIQIIEPKNFVGGPSGFPPMGPRHFYGHRSPMADSFSQADPGLIQTGAPAPYNTAATSPVPLSTQAQTSVQSAPVVTSAPVATPVSSTVPVAPAPAYSAGMASSMTQTARQQAQDIALMDAYQALEKAYLDAVNARNQAEQYRSAYLDLADRLNQQSYQQQQAPAVQPQLQQPVFPPTQPTVQQQPVAMPPTPPAAPVTVPPIQQQTIAAFPPAPTAPAFPQPEPWVTPYAAPAAYSASTATGPMSQYPYPVAQFTPQYAGQYNPYAQPTGVLPESTGFQFPGALPGILPGAVQNAIPSTFPGAMPGYPPIPGTYPAEMMAAAQQGWSQPYQPWVQPVQPYMLQPQYPQPYPGMEQNTMSPVMPAPMNQPDTAVPPRSNLQFKSVDELNQMIAQPVTLQDKVDAMEELAIRGQGNDLTYQLLMQEAMTDTSFIDDPRAKNDANYIRQAGLWTLGMLLNSQYSDAPMNHPTLQSALDVMEQIVDNKNEDAEVKIAVVQALRVLNRLDKRINKILDKAEKQGKKLSNKRLQEQSKAALSGEPIPLPAQPQAAAASSVPVMPTGMPMNMPVMPAPMAAPMNQLA